MEHIEFVKTTFANKIKIKDTGDLKKICQYLNHCYRENINNIEFGNKIVFNIFDINLIKLKRLKIRPETIFKINLIAVKCQLLNIFKQRVINIGVLFEETSKNQLVIHKSKNHYKHDVIIKIFNDKTEYEIGLEYNEKNSHNNTRQINNDNSRNINSEMFFDLFLSYNESSNNYYEFMRELIYELIVIICSLSNDKYFLAKILYLKNKTNTTQTREDDFDLFLNWKKINVINLENLYNIMIPRHDDGFEYSQDDYIEHLIDDFDLSINKKECDYDTFIQILNNESNDCSQKILDYRTMLSTVSNKLTDASDEIIKLMKKINEKTQLLIPYTEEMIKNLHMLNNVKLVKLGISNYNNMNK
jgi:hypothetical protein